MSYGTTNESLQKRFFEEGKRITTIGSRDGLKLKQLVG